jgi:hypothetical protein
VSERQAAVHRLVVSGDVKGSGRLGLQAKLRTRAVMYEVFGAALKAVDVRPPQLHMEDRGDGVLMALDPGVPPESMAGLWLEEVCQGLRERNEGLRERLRMRIAMHSGPVSYDGRSLVGRAVDLTCRLCDSERAKAVLDADERPDLVFVVSDSFYESVVKEGGRFIEPETYRVARVTAKETDETAWFHVPRLPEPPLRLPAAPQHPVRSSGVSAPGEPPVPRPEPEPATKHQVTVHGQSAIIDGVRGDANGVFVDQPHRDREGDPR